MLYDVNGRILYNDKAADFSNNMELDYAYDSATGANYTVIRVFKTKRDGTKQYPFVRYPGRMRTAALMADENWLLAINAGVGLSEEWAAGLGRGSTYTDLIDGVAIENGVVIAGNPAEYHAGAIPLTIDANGDLGTAAADATGASLIASNTVSNGKITSGIVSATCGFCPIIEDYAPTESFPTVSNVTHFTDNAQRQIIGQWGNGDYAIISCAGRNMQNSDGWTLAEAQTVCQKLGLKFAYNLDGGTSTSTYLGKKPVWDFQGGARIVPSFIVFNGSDQYAVP
ncbi:MAG: phosphodiester glycosidase family protein [Clostridia bacterium]|nr:phosphodiester glycosidase family protein [Clostridia bacterium]